MHNPKSILCNQPSKSKIVFFPYNLSFCISSGQWSLSRLMTTLNQANPFFIRCIKSNSDKVSETFCLKSKLASTHFYFYKQKCLQIHDLYLLFISLHVVSRKQNDSVVWNLWGKNLTFFFRQPVSLMMRLFYDNCGILVCWPLLRSGSLVTITA